MQRIDACIRQFSFVVSGNLYDEYDNNNSKNKLFAASDLRHFHNVICSVSFPEKWRGGDWLNVSANGVPMMAQKQRKFQCVDILNEVLTNASIEFRS